MFQPNPNVDHLDPANWWPHYDLWSDRRAIPARAALVLHPDLDYWIWDHHKEPAEGRPGWYLVSGVGGPSLIPDTSVYIAESHYQHFLPQLPAALGETFNALWAYHQAGHISRVNFDARAAKLRELRDTITKQLENHHG